MNTIIAENIKTKNTSNVWMVSIQGKEERSYCKSARSAMKLMFLLKKRTGARIEDNSLRNLSAAIKEQHLAENPEQASTAEKFQEALDDLKNTNSVENVLDDRLVDFEEGELQGINPYVANAIFIPDAPAASEPVTPAPKRRGRPRKNKKTEGAE